MPYSECQYLLNSFSKLQMYLMSNYVFSDSSDSSDAKAMEVDSGKFIAISRYLTALQRFIS